LTFLLALQRGPQISQSASIKVTVEDNFSLGVYSVTIVAQAMLLKVLITALEGLNADALGSKPT